MMLYLRPCRESLLKTYLGINILILDNVISKKLTTTMTLIPVKSLYLFSDIVHFLLTGLVRYRISITSMKIKSLMSGGIYMTTFGLLLVK